MFHVLAKTLTPYRGSYLQFQSWRQYKIHLLPPSLPINMVHGQTKSNTRKTERHSSNCGKTLYLSHILLQLTINRKALSSYHKTSTTNDYSQEHTLERDTIFP